MAEVIVSKTIRVPAEEAWEQLSSFRGMEKFSPITSCVTFGFGAGATRTCRLPGMGPIFEELDEVVDEKMEMQYRITEGPFPITDYVSNIKVARIGQRSCTITWKCEFQASADATKQMVDLFDGFYHTIIDSLENVILHQN